MTFAPLFSFLGVCIVLLPIAFRRPDMLVLNRFFPGSAALEAILLAVYAAFLTERMSDVRRTMFWRSASWIAYTVWFFLQLGLGMLAESRFLLTGAIHIPVPALIISQPIFEMRLTFMIFLVLGAVFITGPAWCSHLCYLGGVDNLFSRMRPLPRSANTASKKAIKYSMAAFAVAAALVCRALGMSASLAAACAIAFGVVGIGVMAFISRNRGVMMHCTVFCPIGTVVAFLKRISPFRMRIDASCTDCMRCTKHCRCGALTAADIARRVPGNDCTYCGDCVPSCPHASIRYRFFGLSAGASRTAWLTVSISLHAVFFGLGRI